MNLIHPIPIKVQPLNTAATIYDEQAREEIQIVKRQAEFEIAAQVEYREFATHGKLAEFTSAGLKEGELGYVLVRTVDTMGASWSPAIGDRITAIGVGTLIPSELKVYVTRIKLCAHYPGVGHLGIKLYFSDKKPSHNG